MLEECLAKLDGGKYGLTFSSGLGATTAITQMLTAGDHILSGDDIYGGTNRYFSKVLSKFQVITEFVDLCDLAKFEAAIKPNTRVSISTGIHPVNIKLTVFRADGMVGNAHESLVEGHRY